MIFEKLYQKLDRIASKSGVILLFLFAHLFLVLMMIFTFPKINAKLGTEAFDLKTFGYSFEEATSILSKLDESTIDFYMFPQLLFLDLFYPILLALFLSTLIIRLTHLTGIKRNHLFSFVFLLPFVAMFCDYVENLLILFMIKNASEVSSGIITTASFFTQMKGLSTTLSWISILVLSMLWVLKKWRSKAKFQTKAGLQ